MDEFPKLRFNVKPVHTFKYKSYDCTILDIGYEVSRVTSPFYYGNNANIRDDYQPSVYYTGFIVKFEDYPEWKIILRQTKIWGSEPYSYRLSEVAQAVHNRVVAHNEDTLARLVDMTSDFNFNEISEDEKFAYVKNAVKEAKRMVIRNESYYHFNMLNMFPLMFNVDGEDMPVNYGRHFTTKLNHTLEVR